MKLALICDAVLAAILVISSIRGFRRGFIRTAFGCLTVVAAILLSYFFGSYAADFIRTTKVYESAEKGVYNVIAEKFDGMKKDGLENIEESRKGFEDSETAKNLERLGLDVSSLFDRYEMSVEDSADQAVSGFAKDTAKSIAHCLANAAGILAVFLVSLVLLKLLGFLLDKVFRLPLLKSINSFAGFVVGIALGVLCCFVLCTVVEILIPYIPKNPVVYAGMERDTYLYGFFLNLNPVILLLFG